MIQHGTTREQESVIGTLKNIVERAAHLKSPAVIVLGNVVELNEQLQWFVPEISLGFDGDQGDKERDRALALHS